ncbi:LacI family DNA-binding transcriptional regulator [uncultured Ruthenibacterium sp.]|uniref:LacI family DNA-binding transcriptional regulator n=1 Tax=uncultured Ruthenibacterium sp. TaxID=1905347 RepID=UPI00349E680A
MNIYDIACLAGVSTATVSRVLNHSGRVSEASRKKVEEVIAREGYIPNAFAHNLNTKKSRTIGIICPVISDPNHAYPVAELSKLLRANGFEILLISTVSNDDSKRPYFVSLINRQVDAAILIGCNCSRQEQEDFVYAAKHVPVFVLNGKVEGPNIYCTLCDEKSAAEQVVKKFTEAGYQRVLYLYDSETYSGEMKLAGYKEGMRKYSQAEPLVVQVQDELSSFYKTLDTVRDMIGQVEFDAILTADDSLAIGAVKALGEAGRRDVPAVGFNNTILSRCATPELSSVDNRMKQQCALTVQTLLSVLQGEKAPACVTLDAQLIERGPLQKQLERKQSEKNGVL